MKTECLLMKAYFNLNELVKEHREKKSEKAWEKGKSTKEKPNWL
jgi:hypothetical protein